MIRLSTLTLVLSGLLFLLHVQPLQAAPGEQLYVTYCSACHAPDGKGASNGMFPPLAKSEWVQGDPARMTQVILKGLQGKITVTGKDYDLVMPPQGDALTDAQIAGIATYVRSAWGNKESGIETAFVSAQRKKFKDVPPMWNAEDLLKKFPLKNAGKKPRGIVHLISNVYQGPFKNLAAMRKAEAIQTEEEVEGLISLKHTDKKHNFGIVWEGHLDVPYDGRYQFFYDTDDGGALTVNGKQIITRDRIGPKGKPSKKAINLKKGKVPIKIEYYQNGGASFVSLFWDGPGVRKEPLSNTKGQGSSGPSIPLKPDQGEAIIYRNFIAGTDARAIAVGYPEGVHIAFNAKDCSLDLAWHGKFMDAGRHWTNRGKGFEAPAGENVVQVNEGLPFARLATAPESNPAPWPKNGTNALQANFDGYELGEKRRPTFFHQVGGFGVSDTVVPDGPKSFVRTISFTPTGSDKATANDAPLFFRLANKAEFKKEGANAFVHPDGLTITVLEAPSKLLNQDKSLLLQLPNTKATVKVRYQWK